MGRRAGPRGVVVVAHSSAMGSSSALRSIPPTAARDGKDLRDTSVRGRCQPVTADFVDDLVLAWAGVAAAGAYGPWSAGGWAAPGHAGAHPGGSSCPGGAGALRPGAS